MDPWDPSYRWHSPHPGLSGAAARIPGAARAEALRLEGTVTTAAEAVERIRMAVGRGYYVRELSGCVLLHEDREPPRNVWRVIVGEPVALRQEGR